MNWSERDTWNEYYSDLRRRGRQILCEYAGELDFNEPIRAFLDQRLETITDSILDVGAGPFSGSYLDTDKRTVRTDISQKAFIFENPHAVSVAADAIALPFPRDTFKAVVSKEVYGYVDASSRMVEEMVRVLKPGGIFILVDSEASLPAGEVGRAVDFRPEDLIPQLIDLGIRDVEVHRLKPVSAVIDGKQVTGHISALVGVKI
jgi:SAM-dependent methyltransferase